MRARLLLATALAALGAGAAAGGLAAAPAPPRTVECAGLPTCIDVPGPWVAVPARGEASFLLECPQRRGVVGGVDSLASSRDVHVVFEGLLGGPVSPGRTTTRYAFFHAVSGRHRAGLFEPRIGCIPTGGGQRSTTSARALTPAGAPLDLAATLVPVEPDGSHLTLACAAGRLVDSWTAVSFAVPVPPSLASAVRVHSTVVSGRLAVTINPSRTLPRSARTRVQVGVACAR